MSVIHHAAPLLTALFRAVLQASWQGALAIVLVLIVRRVLGARVPARWHYLLWFLVLVRLLAPTSVLPHSPASLENIHAVAQPFDRQSLLSAEQEASRGMTVVMPPALATSHRVTSSRPPTATIPAVTRYPWSWQAFATLAWLAGAVSLCIWLTACSLNLRRRMNRETVPADADLVALWQACCRRWLRRTAPPVLTATWVHSPALVGAWQPTLLLPRQMADSFSAQDWEHVFAHEIAHLRWRDHWSQLVLLAAWCVHWFNPVVWLGLRRLRADRELAADDWALRRLRGDRALAYGETLLKTLAQRPASFAFQPGMVGISEDGAQMKQRLRCIAAFLPQRRFVGSLAGFAVVIGLGTVVLGQGSSAPAVSPPSKEPAAQPAATPAVPSVETLATEAQKFSDALLAAARAGDAAKVSNLIDSSQTPRAAKFSESTATAMLDDLVRRRELTAFTVLHDRLKQTNYGKDWKPDDGLLAALVKDGRTDFLNFLLARRFDLNRLKTLAAAADRPTADWITRRVVEVTKQRADLEALEKAAENNDLPAMGRLVDGGADVNGVGQDDNTPLLRTVSKDRLEAAQWLLDHGAQVDKPRFPGWNYTPLCLVNSVPMAELLKKNGANLHAKLWRRDVNILFYVAMFGKAEVVQWFLQQGLDPKMIGDNNENLLFNLKDGQTARLLLEAGVDPNKVNSFGATPICSAGSAEVAQVLIEHGARVTGFKEPLLPRMIQFGSGEAVEAALKAGADHDPEMLQDALIGAAHMDRSDIVQVLIRYGAKPNEISFWNREHNMRDLPLEVCCIFGSVKTAKVLLAAGADPNAQVPSGPGPMLKIALRNGYKELAILLREAGARGVSDLAFAIAMHDQAGVTALLANAPTYAEDPTFWADALSSAARVGDVATVRAALAKGAPMALEPSTHEEDAYSAACWEGQDEALAVLLATRKRGDDPKELREALWGAVWNDHPYGNQRSVEHFERCVRMLLDAGAPVNGDDGQHHEKNLVSGAVFSRNPGGNPAVMEMLLRAGADPNPVVGTEKNPQAHLLEAVQEACAKGYCSTPVAETLIKLNHLASPTGNPPAPSPTPVATPTPQDQGAKPEQAVAGSPTPAPKAKVIEVEATASTEDGAPLRFDEARIHPSMVFGPSGATGEQFFPSFNSDGTSPDGHSLMRIPSDAEDVGIAVTKEGYAAAFAGPFSPPLEEKLKGLHFTLTKGISAEVQTVDEEGKPIVGARLKCHYSKRLYLDFAETTTDAESRASLAHIGAGLLDLLVRADGYQADEADGIQLDPAKPFRWTLKKAQPLFGYVTASDGQPIAGAKIKLAGVRGPFEETHADAPHAPMWATADAQGRFALTSLRTDSRYFFFVDAPGFAGKLLSGITVTQPELKVSLGPELFVRGRFLHVPADSINTYDNTLVFGYDQFFDIEGKFWTVGQQGRVNPKNGEADFTINALYDNAVVIRAEDKEINLEARELPKSGLVIDLTPEPASNINRPPPPPGVVYTLGTPAKH